MNNMRTNFRKPWIYKIIYWNKFISGYVSEVIPRYNKLYILEGNKISTGRRNQYV